MSEQNPASERVRVQRYPARAAYDRETIDAILDEGLICHVGFTVNSQPFVIPTTYARAGNVLFIHGSPASRMVGTLSGGLPVCIAVTLLDGLVLARSAFNHSMNYRSVVILGTAREVTGPAEKLAALRALIEHIVPGRWKDVRHPGAKELERTTVLAVPITEASAKIRQGGPVDEAEDGWMPVWAGQIPLQLSPLEPIPDSRTPPSLAAPDYAIRYRHPGYLI